MKTIIFGIILIGSIIGSIFIIQKSYSENFKYKLKLYNNCYEATKDYVQTLACIELYNYLHSKD